MPQGWSSSMYSCKCQFNMPWNSIAKLPFAAEGIKCYLCISVHRPSGAVTSFLCNALWCDRLDGIWKYTVVLMYWSPEVYLKSFWKISGTIEICTLGFGVLLVDVNQFSLNQWPLWFQHAVAAVLITQREGELSSASGQGSCRDLSSPGTKKQI